MLVLEACYSGHATRRKTVRGIHPRTISVIAAVAICRSLVHRGNTAVRDRNETSGIVRAPPARGGRAHEHFDLGLGPGAAGFARTSHQVNHQVNDTPNPLRIQPFTPFRYPSNPPPTAAPPTSVQLNSTTAPLLPRFRGHTDCISFLIRFDSGRLSGLGGLELDVVVVTLLHCGMLVNCSVRFGRSLCRRTHGDVDLVPEVVAAKGTETETEC